MKIKDIMIELQEKIELGLINPNEVEVNDLDSILKLLSEE